MEGGWMEGGWCGNMRGRMGVGLRYVDIFGRMVDWGSLTDQDRGVL